MINVQQIYLFMTGWGSLGRGMTNEVIYGITKHVLYSITEIHFISCRRYTPDNQVAIACWTLIQIGCFAHTNSHFSIMHFLLKFCLQVLILAWIKTYPERQLYIFTKVFIFLHLFNQIHELKKQGICKNIYFWHLFKSFSKSNVTNV